MFWHQLLVTTLCVGKISQDLVLNTVSPPFLVHFIYRLIIIIFLFLDALHTYYFLSYNTGQIKLL